MIFFLSSVLTFVLRPHKNRFIEMVLLVTHNICFGSEIKKNLMCILDSYLEARDTFWPILVT